MALWKIVLVAALLAGCGSVPRNTGDADQTVERLLNDPKFQSENLPIRTVDVAVFADTFLGEEDARRAVEAASQLLEQQVGIRLRVTYLETVAWQKRDTNTVLDHELEHLLRGNDFDLAIGFTYSFSARDLECKETSADSTCIVGRTVDWRYIHVRVTDPAILAHEVGHAFLRVCGHSPTGLMRSVVTSQYLSLMDRAAMLKNKQMNFKRDLFLSERCGKKK